MQVRTYRAASRELLAKAKQEARGHLRQASEKAWGTAAQMVKAIAEQRGWHHDNHRYFFGIVGQLPMRRTTGPLPTTSISPTLSTPISMKT